MRHTAQELRDHAEELMVLAAMRCSDEDRQRLISLADDYRNMADCIEKLKKPPVSNTGQSPR
jgi:hypothetical protein